MTAPDPLDPRDPHDPPDPLGLMGPEPLPGVPSTRRKWLEVGLALLAVLLVGWLALVLIAKQVIDDLLRSIF